MAGATVSGKRRHGAEAARGAGRHFDPYGEAAPRRGVYGLQNATLALVVRQGRIDLGVRTGRGLSSARGAAEAEAPEMPIDLGTR